MFDRHGNRKYLNGSERRALLLAIGREPDPAFRCFGLMLFYTGCRISEALNLTVGRVDLAQKALVIETLKRRRSGHFRPVPVPDAMCAQFRALVRNRASSERVWSFSRATGYRHVKRLMTEAGITGSMASPKGMRHAMAVACLAHKIPLTTVQTWLGHARLETTAIYLHVSGDEERALARRLWGSS